MVNTTHPNRPSALIFGAGGRLGGTLVGAALKRGLHVRAVIHDNNPLGQHPRLQVVAGDVRHPDTIDDYFSDIDIVLASLGSAGANPPDVAGTGAEHIVELMGRHRLRRLVTVTGSGAALAEERLTPWHALKRTQMRIGAPSLLADGDRHLNVLATSGLDWTTIRVPYLTPHNVTDYTLNAIAPNPAATLPYAAAATAMLDALGSTSWHQSAPFASTTTIDRPSASGRQRPAR